MPRRPALALAVIAALLSTAAATAAAFAVTIDLAGGTGARTLRACGITHHNTLYRRGSSVAIAGAVSPAPSAFRVKLKVKQCVHGRYVAIWTAGAHEGPNGAYSGAYVARRRGSFFARAYIHAGSRTVRSDKRYFRVG